MLMMMSDIGADRSHIKWETYLLLRLYSSYQIKRIVNNSQPALVYFTVAFCRQLLLYLCSP